MGVHIKDGIVYTGGTLNDMFSYLKKKESDAFSTTVWGNSAERQYIPVPTGAKACLLVGNDTSGTVELAISCVGGLSVREDKSRIYMLYVENNPSICIGGYSATGIVYWFK